MTYPGPAWLVRVSGDVDFGGSLAPGHLPGLAMAVRSCEWLYWEHGGAGTGGGGPPWLGEDEGLSR